MTRSSAKPAWQAAWAACGPAVEKRLLQAEKSGLVQRVWDKDASLWKKEAEAQKEIRSRLGWLTAAQETKDKLGDIVSFAGKIEKEGFRHAVLLGMGGSSLAPEVLQAVFGNRPGRPELIVLDSTDPLQVGDVELKIDIDKTLFIVSSKSGGTIELVTLFKYFFEKVKSRGKDPGRRFVAITDPGTSLAESAGRNRFRKVFLAPPDVGGRFSALTFFGLVPAALIGVDVAALLDGAGKMAEACSASVPASQNPALVLGTAMATLAEEGRDKLTILTPPGMESFGDWTEQLVAESTGKEGIGILPVVREPLGEAAVYGKDRFFVVLAPDFAKEPERESRLKALEKAGHPVLTLRFQGPSDLGGEFFRWEMATAIASALFKINAFDQPDVQAAKDGAKALLRKIEAGENLPARISETSLESFWKEAQAGDYVAILAFLPAREFVKKKLFDLALGIRALTRLAVTVGLGPRYLHSTGQFHKGGPNKGLFVLITGSHDADLAIPGEKYKFGQLELAQAMGDFEALEAKGRRLVHLRLENFSEEALDTLCGRLKNAVLKTQETS